MLLKHPELNIIKTMKLKLKKFINYPWISQTIFVKKNTKISCITLKYHVVSRN